MYDVDRNGKVDLRENAKMPTALTATFMGPGADIFEGSIVAAVGRSPAAAELEARLSALDVQSDAAAAPHEARARRAYWICGLTAAGGAGLTLLAALVAPLWLPMFIGFAAFMACIITSGIAGARRTEAKEARQSLDAERVTAWQDLVRELPCAPRPERRGTHTIEWVRPC